MGRQPLSNLRLPDGGVLILDPLDQGSVAVLCELLVGLRFRIENGPIEAQVDYAFQQATRVCANPDLYNADEIEWCKEHQRTVTRQRQELKFWPNEVLMHCVTRFRFIPAQIGVITLRQWYLDTARWWKTETFPAGFPGLYPYAVSVPRPLDDDDRPAHEWVFGISSQSESGEGVEEAEAETSVYDAADAPKSGRRIKQPKQLSAKQQYEVARLEFHRKYTSKISPYRPE